MAKKKKRKETKKEKSYYVELYGFLLIAISILGICRLGPFGEFVSGFSAYLVGVWYNILLGTILITGGYMIVRHKRPNYLSSNLIGIYLIFLGLLIFSHIGYIKDAGVDSFKVFEETITNFSASFKNINNLQGSGVIGALFSWAFVKLFELKGTYILSIIILISGIIMFTGLSIYDILKGLKSNAKKVIDKTHKSSDKGALISSVESEEPNDNKVVVSSVDELIHKPDVVETETKENTEVEKEIIIEDDYTLNKGYRIPSINLLNKPNKSKGGESPEVIKNNVDMLEQVLKDFQFEGHVVAINPGPTVTQYEMELKAGTKLSKILGINREIALALAARDVRIQAPIPGKKTIGVEIPNKVTTMVTVREILDSVPKNLADSKLLVALGKNIMGTPMFCEINKTPHMLVAGSTGSGKSVCINSMLVSLLMRTKPDEVKLVLVDPKKVELSMYNGAPHLLIPVVTEPKKANLALKKIVVEMEHRYDLFSETGTKNIAGYNELIDKKNESLPDSEKIKRLPFIVVVIDELADLMLVAAKEVEDSIMRITQMARAAGIHLIVATQRPSTDVITGVVKANIPTRVSFAVSSSIDSRTILDQTGAEKLLGKGDMLFFPQGEISPTRIQGTFISDEEIKKVVDYTISQQKARYDETLLMDEEEAGATTMVEEHDATEEPLYNEIVEFVVTQGKASASLLQRRFRLGYNRAARCIDLLEDRGIIGPQNGSKPREVLIKLENKDND